MGAELNAWLEDQCIAYAKRTKHPEFKERTIWDVFQEERASLMELRGPFDGFVEKAVRASTTCLIMADHNRYSVDARAAGRMVLVRSHAERIVVLLGEEAVADHPRCFRRDQIIYDPWHYLPVLMKKPGALRNGAPFKDWNLPPALTQVRAKLKQHADGDRQFVKVLGAVLDHGLAAVESACAEALEAGIASGDVILTVLARRRQCSGISTAYASLAEPVDPRGRGPEYDQGLRGPQADRRGARALPRPQELLRGGGTRAERRRRLQTAEPPADPHGLQRVFSPGGIPPVLFESGSTRTSRPNSSAFSFTREAPMRRGPSAVLCSRRGTSRIILRRR